MSAVLELTQQLIARPSNTPDDADCCALLASRLQPLGFEIEYLNANGVTNLWATLRGGDGPLFILAGHTDVVPAGPLDQWKSNPFQPEIRDGVLYGRGAADMKSGIAAMVCAAERLVQQRKPKGTLAFLITSDEEGVATHGTKHVVEMLKARGVKPDYAIVGEASSNQQLGDRIVVGRRGSLGCNLKIIGKQGHVAYPHKADNPIHRALPVLAELAARVWDKGNAYFPPTSFQISNFKSGTGANNVIPGDAEVIFNFRYCTESTAAGLKAAVHETLDRHGVKYEVVQRHVAVSEANVGAGAARSSTARIPLLSQDTVAVLDWWHTGEPFLTRQGALIGAAGKAIQQVTGLTPEQFTGGGTSDARFIAPWGAEVVEIGPINDSIHKINEHVNVADLDRLSAIYEATLNQLL